MKKITFIALLGFAGAALSVSAHQGMAHGSHGAAHSGPSAHDIAQAPLSADVTVSACWVRSMPLPAPSAGYFVVDNKGASAVQLVGAASAPYDMVMLHQTTNQDGLSRMSHTEAVAIAAGGQLEFKPGGYHAMLEKPNTTIKIGDTIAMDFLFDNGQKATAQCEVKPAKTTAN